MKIAWAIVLSFSLLMLGLAYAQAQAPMAQPTIAPEVQNLMNQLHAVGCQSEEQAAAQTIASLQKQNADLKAQIQKLDPPKSGATKR